MTPPEKRGSRTPCQGPAPVTSEAPPSTATVPFILADTERLGGRSPVSSATLPLFARAVAAGHLPVAGALPPVLMDRLDELDRRAAEGALRRCPHLHGGDAGPPVLLPWEGAGRLRCGPCALEAQCRLRGTVEDHRCDTCGELVEWLSTCVVLARGLVILVAVCDPCRAAGQAGPA